MRFPIEPRKQSQYRIERPRALEIQDETSHLWAVSYSDLLMVLLSFFILFFSMGDKKPDIIRKLIPVDLMTGEIATEPQAEMVAAPRPDMNLEIQKIAGLTVQQIGNSSVLNVQFPNDIYRDGSSDLTEEAQQQLLQLFKKLSPILSQLEIEIVGHTDATPVTKRKSKYLQDNLDLSFLRASQALRFILNHREIRAVQISAKGSADTVLASRTLSVTIRPKGATQ